MVSSQSKRAALLMYITVGALKQTLIISKGNSSFLHCLVSQISEPSVCPQREKCFHFDVPL